MAGLIDHRSPEYADCLNLVNNLNDMMLNLTEIRYGLFALVIAAYLMLLIHFAYAAVSWHRRRRFLYRPLATKAPSPIGDNVRIQITKASHDSTTQLIRPGMDLPQTDNTHNHSAATDNTDTVTSAVTAVGEQRRNSPLVTQESVSGDMASNMHDWQLRQRRLMRPKRAVQMSFRKHLKHQVGAGTGPNAGLGMDTSPTAPTGPVSVPPAAFTINESLEDVDQQPELSVSVAPRVGDSKIGFRRASNIIEEPEELERGASITDSQKEMSTELDNIEEMQDDTVAELQHEVDNCTDEVKEEPASPADPVEPIADRTLPLDPDFKQDSFDISPTIRL